MNFRRLFPYFLAASFALSFSAGAFAQSSESDPRQTNTTIDLNGTKRLETDLSVPTSTVETRSRTLGSKSIVRPFDQLLLKAIESHLGASYRYNHTGPDLFDCSGFVWRAFQDIGLNFTRGPARSYWATFAAPPKEEQFKFGTLVFFSGLTHVGIVADEKGFYHSARHGGVMYSPFNEYWLSRIDGFRRVPLESLKAPAITAKAKPAKSAASTVDIDEDNQP